MAVHLKRCKGTVGYLGGLMSVPEPFAWSLVQMVQYNSEYLCEPGEYVHYDRAAISFHAWARNNLAERMRGDWLLQLDTDHRFDPDLCARLVKLADDHEADVLAGIYQFKSAPYSPVLYQFADPGFVPIGDWSGEARLFPVEGAGAGCLFVRRGVFERIRRELGEGPFDILPPFGEDFSFFRRLAKLGITAYCAPAVECHHLRYQALALTDYDRTGLLFGERQEVEGYA